jgi:hypothetical protein
MTKLLLTSIILLSFSVSFAQDYIVTARADTVRGDVKMMSYDLMDRAQLSQGKKKTTYTAVQVRRIVLNGEQFVPVRYDNGIRLMKVIQQGYLSLYAHRAPQQGGYDTKVLQKIGREAIEVPNIGFKKIFGDIIEDCPDVADQVKTGNLDRNKVTEIVAEYNKCIGARNQQKMEAVAAAKSTPAGDLIEKLKTKVSESDLSNKNDVNDLLNSMADRLKKNEPVPAYMKEGLKGYLGSKEDLKADLEQLLTLLGN